jgi:hypothetical protein
VHALGLLLSEVMTDMPPFSDPDPHAHLFEQVMATLRPTPGSKGRDVGVFEPVLAKALALSPRDRFRSAGELLSALEEAGKAGTDFEAGPGDTAPATVMRRPEPTAFQSSVRRHVPLVAAGVALTGLAIVAGRALMLPKSATPENRSPSVAAAPAPPRTTTAELPHPLPTAVMTTPIRSAGAPLALTAPATNQPSPPPSVAPKPRPTARKLIPTALPSAAVLDGRELFNDTK